MAGGLSCKRAELLAFSPNIKNKTANATDLIRGNMSRVIIINLVNFLHSHPKALSQSFLETGWKDRRIFHVIVITTDKFLELAFNTHSLLDIWKPYIHVYNTVKIDVYVFKMLSKYKC